MIAAVPTNLGSLTSTAACFLKQVSRQNRMSVRWQISCALAHATRSQAIDGSGERQHQIFHDRLFAMLVKRPGNNLYRYSYCSSGGSLHRFS